eukprot:578514-Amphidinium_carterae.1
MSCASRSIQLVLQGDPPQRTETQCLSLSPDLCAATLPVFGDVVCHSTHLLSSQLLSFKA